MAGLFLLCALPGAGKSTFAKKFLADNPHIVYLSSDRLRAVYGKSEEDQSASGEVFAAIRNMVKYFLREGISVMVDATNTNIAARKTLVEIARSNNGWVTAFEFAVPFEVCVARNEARARKVPLFVLERMRDGWQSPTVEEVDEVIIIGESGECV